MLGHNHGLIASERWDSLLCPVNHKKSRVLTKEFKCSKFFLSISNSIFFCRDGAPEILMISY